MNSDLRTIASNTSGSLFATYNSKLNEIEVWMLTFEIIQPPQVIEVPNDDERLRVDQKHSSCCKIF